MPEDEISGWSGDEDDVDPEGHLQPAVDLRTAPPFYQPPRLRVTATYRGTSDQIPESLEVEIHDPTVTVTAELVADVVTSLSRVAHPSGVPNTYRIDFTDTSFASGGLVRLNETKRNT